MGFTRCVIPGINLKVFGRAIQSLSKLGDELYFDPLDDGLYLRTVNSNRSAYACFQFAPSFFITYLSNNESDGNGEDGFRCKLTMKSVMNVFRSLPTIDKTVEKCKITHNSQEDKLTFQLYCRHGIVKTHNLSYMDCETLQAVFTKDMCPNKLTAGPKLLCDAVLNFQANQEEVTFMIRPDFLALKNYVDDEPNPAKVVHTELTLSPDEFDDFRVGVDTDITFCLKEFRAILAFCDLTNLPMNMHIESPGRPVTFSITSDLSFEANFVLATLAEPEDNGDQPVHQPMNKTTKELNRKQARTPHNSSRVYDKKQQRNRTRETFHDASGPADETALDINDTTMVDTYSINRSSLNNLNHTTKLFSFSNNKNDSLNKNRLSVQNTNSVNDALNNRQMNANSLIKNKASDNTHSKSLPHGSSPKSPSVTNGHGFYLPSSKDSQDQSEVEKARGLDTNQMLVDDELTDMSQIIPIPDENCTNITVPQQSSTLNDDVNGDEEEDEICGTPPKKKFRSLFFSTQSSTQSTTVASQDKPAVLCPDSDSE